MDNPEKKLYSASHLKYLKMFSPISKCQLQKQLGSTQGAEVNTCFLLLHFLVHQVNYASVGYYTLCVSCVVVRLFHCVSWVLSQAIPLCVSCVLVRLFHSVCPECWVRLFHSVCPVCLGQALSRTPAQIWYLCSDTKIKKPANRQDAFKIK